jgi:PAS domain S-box-containing protein
MLATKQDAANEVDMLREKNVGSATSGMKTGKLEAFAGYQQLVDALGDAVIICDCDGVIRLWNAAAERLFGFTPAEALGSSLDLIIPERFRDRHWAGFTRTMATGQTRYQHDVLRVPAMHKDGRKATNCNRSSGRDPRRNQTLHRRARFAQANSRTSMETRRVSATNKIGS